MTILDQITDAIRAALAAKAEPSRRYPEREQIESDLAAITRCRDTEQKQQLELALFLKIANHESSACLSAIAVAIAQRPPLNALKTHQLTSLISFANLAEEEEQLTPELFETDYLFLTKGAAAITNHPLAFKVQEINRNTIESFKNRMRRNIDTVLQRKERLDPLEEKTNMLGAQAATFRTRALALKKRDCCTRFAHLMKSIFCCTSSCGSKKSDVATEATHLRQAAQP